MNDQCYTLFFYGRDDPRDCVVIGQDTKPVAYVLATDAFLTLTTRTTVSPIFHANGLANG
jgi:hypothetical protein